MHTLQIGTAAKDCNAHVGYTIGDVNRFYFRVTTKYVHAYPSERFREIDLCKRVIISKTIILNHSNRTWDIKGRCRGCRGIKAKLRHILTIKDAVHSLEVATQGTASKIFQSAASPKCTIMNIGNITGHIKDSE